MEPPFRPWADLHADLFLPIVDRLPSPRDYVSVRAVCTAWRSSLPSGPQSPSLLVLDDLLLHDGIPGRNTHVYAVSLPMQRRFRLTTLPCHSSDIVGCSNGYLTIADGSRLRILNPVTGAKIDLLLPNNKNPLRLVVGPNPRPDDYTAVAICDVNKVAYVESGDMEWTITNVIPVNRTRQLVDLVYNADRGDVYCLDERGDVRVLHIPRVGRMPQCTVEPLVAHLDTHPYYHAPAGYAPPYHIVGTQMCFKRVFFCEDTLYQVWKDMRTFMVFRMPLDEIVVLRYYPERWPCWDAVKDLGGYSVFIDENNTRVVQAEAATGIRPNCVYFTDCLLCTPWVFDMSKGTSTQCLLPPTSVGFKTLWYFNSDD
ncbi:hypothetical protein ZWY2020_031309 [Hordeum vulgare]|nr:hypothetical protein ZWY2020_031309 [Hordeum vulgare]